MNVSVRHWVLLLHLLIAISMSSLFNLRRLSQEARSAQAASDQAFDKGDLKQSLNEAEYASLVSISDSQSSKQSIDRIEAIAMGSEATGRPRTALLAWSSLSATFLATRSVASSNSRLGQQPEQHMTYLLSKVTNRPATEAVRSEPLTSSALRMANHWSGSAPLLLGAGLLLGVIGSVLKIGPKRDKIGAQIGRGLYLVAASCWFIGWIVT